MDEISFSIRMELFEWNYALYQLLILALTCLVAEKDHINHKHNDFMMSPTSHRLQDLVTTLRITRS